MILKGGNELWFQSEKKHAFVLFFYEQIGKQVNEQKVSRNKQNFLMEQLARDLFSISIGIR